jgi:replicative DNA helicase
MKNEITSEMPNVLQTEVAVLGALLLDQNAYDAIASDFSANLFYDIRNKSIAFAIIGLYRESKPIDLITVHNKLKELDTAEKAGGIVYLSSLTAKVSSSNNIQYHVRILQEEALRRNLIEIGTKASSKSLDPTQDVFDLFNETQNNLDDALKKVINYEIKNAGDVHDEIMLKSIEMLKTGSKSGVPTGLRLLDNVTNGWQNSDLIILAGRPSMGKTAAAISMCIHPSLEKNEPIAIFSLEMSNEQLVSRMQSYLSGVNVSKIVKKQLSLDEIDKIGKEAIGLKKAPLFIDDTPNISLLDLKGKARKLKKEQGVKLIIIDYLQLMRSGLKATSREQEIAEISRGLKGLAKELNIPVIALSQLSRGVEMRGDKKPMLQDLRESGQIEQDADMVLFCYRPEYYGIDTYEVGNQSFDANGLFMLIIAKHRNGELGEIPLTFIHEQTKLTNHEFGYKPPVVQEDKNRTFVQQENTGNEFQEPLQDKPKSLITANTSFDDEDIFKPDNSEETPF